MASQRLSNIKIMLYTFIKSFHTGGAFFLLLFFIFSIVFTAYTWLNKKPFTQINTTYALFGLVSVHIQFLLGLALYFLSPLGLSNISGAAMKNSHFRFYILEHPLVMIIAVTLVTIGYSKAKRLTVDAAKFKTIVMFYSIGLILILSRFPWSDWFNYLSGLKM
jgi:hypothetical protein